MHLKTTGLPASCTAITKAQVERSRALARRTLLYAHEKLTHRSIRQQTFDRTTFVEQAVVLSKVGCQMMVPSARRLSLNY